MKTLTISKARNTLPALLDRVATVGEAVVVTRHGKPLARIAPVGKKTFKKERYPLRGLPIEIAEDFDAPNPELWSALRP